MELTILIFSILACLISFVAVILVIKQSLSMQKKSKEQDPHTKEMFDEISVKLQNSVNEKFSAENNFLNGKFYEIAQSLQESLRKGVIDQQNSFNGFSKQINGELNQGLEKHSKEIDTSISKMTSLLEKNNNAMIENQAKSLVLLEQRLENISRQINENLANIRQDNTAQLDKMREVVDEKLNKSLEERLTRSFSAITAKLEKVKEEFGKMENLSKGVTDLTKVLNGVKTRGTWGETSLQSLIEDILTTDQYSRNECIRKGKIVEFCIKLPGNEKVVLLPVDSKFPLADYQNLVEYSESGDAEAVQKARKDLFLRIKQEAKDISEYILPPKTTDFAIMYLPIEGLYAEVTRDPVLTDELRRKYKIVVAGPSTFSALLNSLQVGFRTLALQKNSLEIQKVLLSFKTEFSRFVTLLTQSEKKASELSETLQKAIKKTNTIGNKLEKIELPESVETESIPNSTVVGSDNL